MYLNSPPVKDLSNKALENRDETVTGIRLHLIKAIYSNSQSME